MWKYNQFYSIKKMADDITDTVSTVPKMPEIIFKLVYGYSQLCIMKCAFWYLSYIMSSYKHWNVECVGDNHPLIVLNKIGCIFTLVYGYWKYHEMGVLIFILHYVLSLIQLYWPSARVNTAVRGNNTGLISKHPFHDTFINQYTSVKIQPISKHPILTNTLICKIQPIDAIWRGGCLWHIPHFNVCTRT
jgi:hypothetical protein